MRAGNSKYTKQRNNMHEEIPNPAPMPRNNLRNMIELPKVFFRIRKQTTRKPMPTDTNIDRKSIIFYAFAKA